MVGDGSRHVRPQVTQEGHIGRAGERGKTRLVVEDGQRKDGLRG